VGVVSPAIRLKQGGLAAAGVADQRDKLPLATVRLTFAAHKTNFGLEGSARRRISMYGCPGVAHDFTSSNVKAVASLISAYSTPARRCR
jgi:hypothetical protein